MYICVRCHHEMQCDKNDVGADFGNGHIYAADRYKCPTCGKEILATNPRPIYDPDHKTQDEYLDMLVHPPQVTIALSTLFALLDKYDKVYGKYPEHEYEGFAIKIFIKKALDIPLSPEEKEKKE